MIEKKPYQPNTVEENFESSKVHNLWSGVIMLIIFHVANKDVHFLFSGYFILLALSSL